MKAVKWSKLPMRKVGASVWGEPQGAPVKLDYTLMDNLFADYPKIDKENAVAKPTPAKAKANDKVGFLDPKRAQNVAIIAASINIDSGVLKQALLAADASTLLPEVVERLMSLCPLHSDELTQCQQHIDAGALDKLDRAERFLCDLAGISCLEGRLRCMHFQQHFYAWNLKCESSMAALVSASEQVTNSKQLRVLLQYVLAAGNYLNSGTLATHRKNARGVKLNFLLELQKTTTRGHPQLKKPMTFLQIVQNQVLELYPDADKWVSELPGLEQACTEDLSSIAQDMERIEEGATELAKQLVSIAAAEANVIASEKAACGGTQPAEVTVTQQQPISTDEAVTATTPFLKSMASFQLEMQGQVAALRQQKQQLDSAMTLVAKFFGEEPDNAPWVFRTLYTFARQYSKVQEDNQMLNGETAA